MAHLLVAVAILVLVVSVGLPLHAARRWKGGWKFGAVIPLLGLLGACSLILYEALLEPTPDMWAFKLVMVSVITLVVLGIVAGLRERLRS